jgi:polyisoprenoid-binding protein YceI
MIFTLSKSAMKIRLSLLLLSCCLASPLFSQQIDPTASEISFTVGNMGGTVEGSIGGLDGAVRFDPQQPQQATFDVSVAATSLETGIGMRDRHLQGKDFFETKSYPRITFQGQATRKTSEGFETEGLLTINGIPKVVIIPFRVSEEADRQVLTGSCQLDREEFSLGKGYANFIIGQEVSVQIRCVLNQIER